MPGLLFLGVGGGGGLHCSPAANIRFKVAISCRLCYSKLADTQNLCMNLPQSNLITEPPLVDQNTLISDSPTVPGIHVDQPLP